MWRNYESLGLSTRTTSSIAVLSVLALGSCASDLPKYSVPKGEAIAKVDSFYLWRKEADQQLLGKFNSDDSAAIYQQYIRQWIKGKALFIRSMEVLSKQEKDKKALLEQYYADLLVYELENKLLQSNSESEATEVEIESYYSQNQRNFELKENLVRLKFIKVPNTEEAKSRHWYILADNDELDWLKAAKWARDRKGQAFLDETAWLSFNDVLKEIPINTYNQDNYLNNNRFIRTNDDRYLYIVLISDFRIRNSLSPLGYERENIRQIIINKRKVERLQQIEAEIVKETYKTHKVEIF
jgi:hypothetical protein